MKCYFFIFAICMLTFSVHAQTNLWNQVDDLEAQSLPQSALEVVNRIYLNALQTGNSPELLKAMVYQLKYETAIDRDRLPERIREIEQLTGTDKNSVEQAVLYSLLAELYSNYYQADAYLINQRTAILGQAPDDIREWTGNLFIQKIAGLIELSLLPAQGLQQTSVADYAEILTGETSSLNLRPTMYDFLTGRGINLLSALNANDFATQVLKLYQQWLAFRQQENNPKALLMVDLDRLDFVYQHTRDGAGGTDYLEALNRLEKQYEPDDFCVEILYKKVTYYRNQANATALNEGTEKAYTICLSGIEKYPEYDRIGLLKNELNELIESHLTVNANNTVYPGENLELSVNYRNIHQLTVEIYQIQAPVTVYINDWSRNGQYKKSGKLIGKQTIALPNVLPYLTSDTVVRIPVHETGNYEYVLYADAVQSNPVNQQFSVSRLATVARAIDNQPEFLVVDRNSGKPLEGTNIHFYTRKNNSLIPANKSLTTDKNGLASGEKEKDVTFYQASMGNDTALITSALPWISAYRESNQNTNQIYLFTDRSIYRPGQIVYYKGIAASTQASSKGEGAITFRDANYKEIAVQKWTTNEFGSFSGEFVIPQGVLTGNFTLQTDLSGGYANIRVEEYKRPNFDIQFPEDETGYRFGDEITVKGNVKTFSGIRLQNAQVQYRVKRQSHWLFRMRYFPPIQVAEGSLQTNDDGNFEVHFTAEKAIEDTNRPNVTYTYIVEATVTDSNGETQTSNTYLSIGDKSMYLTVNGLGDMVNKAQLPPVIIRAANLSDHPVSVQGSYDIYSLQAKDKTRLDLKDTDWIEGRKIRSGRFKSGKELTVGTLQALPSGRYRIRLQAQDDKGRDIEAQQDFTMASATDKQPPVPVYEWLMTPKTTCKIGESAEIIYGSSAKAVYVLYELFKENKKIAVSRFLLNNENKTIHIPFLESYGDGITAVFSFVKEGKFFSREVSIYKKQPDKALQLNMEVFRDHLLPGQKEEWKLSVKDSGNRPVLAEVLAGMYDASLDKIAAHSWNFNPVRAIHLWSPYNQPGNEFNTSRNSIADETETINVPGFDYNSFNWFGFYIPSRTMNTILRSAKMYGNRDAVVIPEESAGEIADLQKYKIVAQEPVPEAVQVRQNFAETAFFYPQLKTNEAGETLISFTVPESNTTWKFMGLAHTQDLKFGQIAKEVITQKKLMLTPTIPRFMRTGDTMTLTSNISNLSEENIAGTVSLECFDPITNQMNIAMADASKDFSVEAGKTVAVSWTFEVPAGIELTAVKIVAQSPHFSDGEQHPVPVLPNRMLVTESLPWNISGGQTRTFPFDKMTSNTSSTLENYRLTLEFTSNPVWYAVQALPTVGTPQTDDVLSWFSAYYSHTIAAGIANSTPKIKEMIEVWTKQGGTKETLLSNLEKNQELKAVVLEETPWVLEAANETEQKLRLALLFDVNRSNNLTAQALDKLKSLQGADGGWSWFKGMNSSVAITHWILYGMANIPESPDTPKSPERDLVESAVRFIDRQFKKHYDTLKQRNPTGQKVMAVSIYELEYLFVRSLYRDIPLDDAQEAVQFYTGLAGTSWTKNTSLYARALTAMVMQRSGNTKTAQAIIQSLREHASHKPDFGMYWANNNTTCFMTQSAVCVHTFLMEAFGEVGCTPAEREEMQLWLLKQKQTQNWESVPATVNAINILLKTAPGWLSSEGKIAVRWGDQAIDLNSGEPGTGYFKGLMGFKGLKALKENTLTVIKEDAGPAWGALYWQYFEDLDKITAAQTGLNVEKSLIAANNPLKVGDRVTVRLTVRCDRDMEYVLLKDLRASCLEPANQLSDTQWKQGLVYYQSPKDASMNFFFPALPKGTYVFEYDVYVNAPGDYSNGITTIQCLYAPEFVSHTAGGRIVSQ